MRRSDLDAIRKWAYPIVAAVLALVLYLKDAGAETIKGVDGKGLAYVLTINPPCKPACWPPLVVEFVVRFPLPNRFDEGWW